MSLDSGGIGLPEAFHDDEERDEEYDDAPVNRLDYFSPTLAGQEDNRRA